MHRSQVPSPALLWFALAGLLAAEPLAPIPLWPGPAPDEPDGFRLEQEHDKTGPSDRSVAGRPVVRLTNVSVPQLTVFPAPPDRNSGTAVIVCPGGGHHVLAYDLEGTEVCEWLNSLGVTGILLKYRVPRRDPAQPWKHAVQDARQAVSVSRANAATWGIRPDRIGILGFSAGGQTAALAALPGTAPADASSQPDFAVLVYPAYLATKDESALNPEVTVTADAPPMFLVHAFDDGVTAMSSVLLFAELKRHKVSSELHVFPTGGHGYGLRETEEPVTRWPALCETWMRGRGWIP
jgi:acetyl esterase/lipase